MPRRAVIAVPEVYHRRNGGPDDAGPAWYLFNDFLVTPIALSKAVQLASWKVKQMPPRRATWWSRGLTPG